MRISRVLYEQMIEHAREEAPNECAGMIAIEGGIALELYRATNAEASPLRFSIEGKDLLWTFELEDRGLDLGIYHSHVRTDPEPSQTDINKARDWSHALWVIVGLKDEEPVTRAWRIVDGKVSEEELVVE